MGPFAHPLFSAIVAGDVPAPAGGPQAGRRPSQATVAGSAGGLGLNPLFREDLTLQTQDSRPSGTLLDAYLDWFRQGGITTMINDTLGTSLLPIDQQRPEEIALGFAGTTGPGKLSSALRQAPPTGSRAGQQGFGPGLFHGTAADFRRVDPNRAGEAAGFGRLDRFLPEKPALWLTDDPALASYYAKLAAESRGGVGANVMPLRVRSERPVSLDLKGANLNPEEFYGAILDRIDRAVGAKRFGDKLPDTVILDNVPTTLGGPPRTVKVLVSFDPAKVRSVFAKFDPKEASSSDLLAGLAAAGLLLPLGRLAEPEAPAEQP